LATTLKKLKLILKVALNRVNKNLECLLIKRTRYTSDTLEHWGQDPSHVGKRRWTHTSHLIPKEIPAGSKSEELNE
jgi:hypothetical protein